ncbi:hypothetical protein RB620_29350 [Paenibacillus sp. LHD-117]|nr:hypothetical protein [Paenibacillus sp. LHD-117]MDQ6423522.1 hypothetical protein [Paenibacillus sp. LHD-117]
MTAIMASGNRVSRTVAAALYAAAAANSPTRYPPIPLSRSSD